MFVCVWPPASLFSLLRVRSFLKGARPRPSGTGGAPPPSGGADRASRPGRRSRTRWPLHGGSSDRLLHGPGTPRFFLLSCWEDPTRCRRSCRRRQTEAQRRRRGRRRQRRRRGRSRRGARCRRRRRRRMSSPYLPPSERLGRGGGSGGQGCIGGVVSAGMASRVSPPRGRGRRRRRG